MARVVLIAVVFVGVLGSVTTPGTVAVFTDVHGGQATIDAGQYQTNPGNGGGGGGGNPGPGDMTADAGGPYSVTEGATVELDGSNSTNAKGP
ncbi:MAG: hypothetical protein ABEJ57_04725, partial [Halobacteriaceae archaeon]